MTEEASTTSRFAALRTALGGRYLVRALVAAVIVGTVLNAINQGDALLAGAPIDFTKILLTYLVPFCVTTYGAWSALRDSR